MAAVAVAGMWLAAGVCRDRGIALVALLLTVTLVAMDVHCYVNQPW